MDHDKNPFGCFKLMDLHKLLSAFMSLPVPCASTDGGGVVKLEFRSATAVPAEINKVELTLYYTIGNRTVDFHVNSLRFWHKLGNY